ncbi:MAG TPA: hypothetical protein VFI08_12530 [Spirochaetia bacterium]|nr:hypothetical protein [Spirochaetia bacterium]
MVLFLVASLPLLFSLVVVLPWGPRQSPPALALVATYLKGALLFFPGYLVILIVRRIFGFSYDGVLFFLSLLQQDPLVPLLTAMGGFLLLQKTLTITASDERVFLTTFACLSGFLSLVNIADALRTVGQWDAYVLFLLPCLRAAGVLIVALTARRFYRWEGRDGVMFFVAAAAASVGLTVCSYLAYSGRMGWAAGLSAAAVLGAVGVFAGRFPRAVQG